MERSFHRFTFSTQDGAMLDTIARCMVLLLAGCVVASPSLAADKALSVVSTATGASTATVYRGQTIDVDIRVNDAALVAGASFTVSFDAANLALTGVSSTFFYSFANQGLSPSVVTVHEIAYYSPVVANPVTAGAMLAAARANNGTGAQVALFTLSFLIKGSSGSYPISIDQSRIANTSAGYDAAGEWIPFLVGVDAGSFPAHTVTVAPLTVTITSADTDGDGLPDDWEELHFGNTTTANDKSDYDGDGYTDLQEYVHQANNATDPAGGAYDPKLTNAPGGIGYVGNDEDFWNIMIPVIINSARQQ